MEILSGTVLDIRRKILEQIPSEAEITKIEFEGPKIAIYTKKPSIFIKDEEKLIKDIVKTIKKRIVVRADPEARLQPDKAEQLIKTIVPP